MNLITEYKNQEKNFKRNCIPFKAGNKKWFVHNNVNLYINTSLICNANCGFCINKTDNKSTILRIKEKDYLLKLNKVLNMLKPLNPSVSIVGGEPTIDGKLIKILSILKECHLRKQVLNTNGSGIINNKKLIKAINKSEIKHLDISRHHYNDTINQKIMNIKFSNSELEKIIKKIKTDIRIRFNCTLVRRGIKNYNDCIDYLNWAIGLGVDNVAFAQLSNLCKGDIYSEGIMDYTKKNLVLLLPILDKVRKSKKFKFIKKVIGPYYYVEIWAYESAGKADVVFKIADVKHMCEVDYSKENKNYINELIFHPNGRLGGSMESLD